ncbi:hypothetical protein PanWU01x14_157130 [Parasponia andersonii]|uniref:Uncharacterized protein n=1 Tax=Parasponia andersonii TaxID=3476 RepID=A0A2P5CFM1_PARAD|nr:hypothetical protein PanWU01x14_157130 [Parasponia andersonii]
MKQIEVDTTVEIVVETTFENSIGKPSKCYLKSIETSLNAVPSDRHQIIVENFLKIAIESHRADVEPS